MIFRLPPLPALVVWLLLPASALPVAAATSLPEEAQHVLKQHCFSCHSNKKAKGDVNLETLPNGTSDEEATDLWQKVLEQLSLGEMPPADEPQPTEAQRKKLIQSVEQLLDTVAQRDSGDPGEVVLRRLSNAEYTYTIQDLTGVASLAPAREFPADSAAGEGFMNVGNALVMSPALFSKYLEAGKQIGSHLVLLPEGIAFSSSTTARDWTEERLKKIREFYQRFTQPGAGTSVDLQGIKFDTRDGGILPLEKYFQTLLEQKQRPQTAQQSSRAPVGDGISSNYLQKLARHLNATEPSIWLDPVRSIYRQGNSNSIAEIARHVRTWQQSLWHFSTVGHIGKKNGPASWQVPVSPFASAHEFRIKIPEQTNGTSAVVYLVAANLGGSNSADYVLWENVRLTQPGQPDVPIATSATIETPSATPLNNSSNSIRVKAPAVVAITLPKPIGKGTELIAHSRLDPEQGKEGSVQALVTMEKPSDTPRLMPSRLVPSGKKKLWSDGEVPFVPEAPILVQDGSSRKKELEKQLAEFREVFPAALCYTKIVPVDEVVTLALFYREDHFFKELMLTREQSTELDRLWEELYYVSQEPLKMVDVFEQLWQYATQDADPSVFEPLRIPIQQRAAAFRTKLESTQPHHLNALLNLAGKAYRRPLTSSEESALRELYAKLRKEEIPHDEAVRLLLAKILASPTFLYRGEQPPVSDKRAAPIGPWELANRLSYFLWSSLPDEELRSVTAAGQLHQPSELIKQSRRMLRDQKVRRLATEFATAWLQVYNFQELDEKSERHFPTFTSLREAMHEETVLFFADLFQRDGSILEILNANHTFLNEALARHYGIEGVKGEQFRKVSGIHRYGRAGILSQASTLAKNSGASRTSPILRGNWVSEVLLGEKLPRPPKDVPQLPQEEQLQGLSVRELTEKHTSDPRCFGCHRRIDPYGFTLEQFDAIGRLRTNDLGGRQISTTATAFDGTKLEGLDGLKNYLLEQRREQVVKQFCRKLLGYALGRSVTLSDKQLLEQMHLQLRNHDYRFSAAVETILLSSQFQQIRTVPQNSSTQTKVPAATVSASSPTSP
jgi:mono/diheme cytochrome c family protein